MHALSLACFFFVPHPQADGAIRDAQGKVESARQAFQAAVNKANTALDDAIRGFEAADRAFNDARTRAFNDLNNARAKLDQAQRE